MAARMSRPSNPTSALPVPPPFTPEAITAVGAVATVQYSGGPVMLLQAFGYRCSNISPYLPIKEIVSVSIRDILVRIRMRIPGSLPLTNGSGFGSLSKSSMTFGMKKQFFHIFNV
jgi:hypothetical protein